MPPSAKTIPVAIIGMACRLPQANDLDEFWQVLQEGRCTATELPPERLNRELHYAPEKGVRCKTYTTLGCLVDYQPVDPARVPLSEQDIASSDISHLTMAQVAADACRHAGYDPFQMPASFRRAGVYVGHVKGSERGGDLTYSSLIEQTAQFLRQVDGLEQAAGGDPSELIRELIDTVRRDTPHRSRQYNPNLNGSQCAGLLSKMLKLDGPFMVINSACASSLQAIATGVRQIQLGHVEAALVGGAAYCKYDSLVMFSQAQSVSATGTRPFDANADGLINGEGYVAFLLKPLDRALADGDRVQAVIRSIGISCDGRGKSLWAPKKEGQIAAMQRAYGDGLDVTRLQYIEAHATSTQVGDQTEVQSLAETLRDRLPADVKLPIGSVKGNIGHTIETAGAAGVLKTILAMQHGIIPPTANVEQLNPSIDWEHVPLWVPTQPEPWPEPEDGHPRRAAVNSFGIGGLNVHLVIDQGPTADERQPRPPAGVRLNDARQPQLEPIAIVGMGAIFPGARTIDAFLDLVATARDPKTDLPPHRWDAHIPPASAASDADPVPSVAAGFITDFEYDWRTHKVPPKQVAAADPLQFMLLDAVDQAMKQAGYDQRDFDRERTGVCVGAITSGEFHEHLQMGLRLPEFGQTLAMALRQRRVSPDQIDRIVAAYTDVLLRHMPAITDETGSYTSNTLVSRITKTWNLMGGGAAIDAGGASAAATLATCIDLLHAGDCNLMVCAAGQRSMGFPSFQTYAYRDQLACGPAANALDARANGLVPGEGVGVVLLKRLSDAERDGDKVFGVIRGVGAAANANFEQAVFDAIRRAQHQAAISPDEVSHVEVAALGLPSIDRQELAALDRAFDTGERSVPLHVGTLSSQVGFVGSAAAMAAVLKSTASLQRVESFANLHFDQPADYLAKRLDVLHVSPQSTEMPVVTDDGRLFAGVNVSCFDQLAYHIVMQRPENVPASQTPRPAPRLTAVPSHDASPWGTFRIVRLSAASLDQLTDRVQAALHNVGPLFEGARHSSFSAADAIRLAIVCQDASELEQKLRLAAGMIGKPAARVALEEKGIFCRPRLARPRVALLFPGHGSQYTGMLQPLTEAFAPAGEALARIEHILHTLEYPSFRDVAWQQDEQLGVDVWSTQLALLCADTIVFRTLTAIGLEADCVAGHSFGEFAALLAAGAWDFENAARATRARCAAIEATPSAQGIMMSVAAEPNVLDRYNAAVTRRITVSVRNAPDQFVVGGDEASIRQLAEWLSKDKIQTRILPAPRPFHTPLMEAVKAPFARAIQAIDLRPPRTPLLSSVTNRYVADPVEIRGNLVDQLTEPVHYGDLITRLHDDGFNVFVEAGPHQILTKLHRRLLDEQAVVMTGADVPKRHPIRQLANLRASLECAGVFERDTAPALFGSQAAALPAARPRHKVAAEVTSTPARETVSSRLHFGPLNLIRMAGTPYEMGLQHGSAQTALIRKLIRRYADLIGSRRGSLPDVSHAMQDADAFFGEPELEEMRGIADGAGVRFESVVAHNLMLYPDSGAGCAHFALTAAANPSVGMLHATNEDQPLALSVGECLARSIQVRRPAGGIPHVVFSVVGQLAGINGMNTDGLVVSSAMLLDTPRQPGRDRGLAQAAIVNRILGGAADIATAVEIAREHCGAGGWSMCLSSHTTDDLTYLEYDGRALEVRPRQRLVLAANHCKLHQATADVPGHSRFRLARLEQLLDAGDGQPVCVSIEQAQRALRDRFDVQRGRETTHPTMNTVRRVDNQASIVMQPAAGKVWVADCTTKTEADHFFELDVNMLFDEAEPHAEQSQPATSVVDAKLLTGEAARQSLAAHGIGPATQGNSICYRYALRVVETALPEDTPLSLTGASLLIGDNPVSRALKQRLAAAVGRVSLVPGGDEAEAALAELERAWQQQPILNLFVCTSYDMACDSPAELDDATQRRHRVVSVPFLVLQRWVQLLTEHELLDRATVIAATRLGGSFGVAGPIAVAEGGGLTGLIKSLHIELGLKTAGRFTARAVDFSEGQAPHEIAAALCRELASTDREVEVGYVGHRRFVVRPVAEAAMATNAPAPQGAWLITGGARGVTAVVARELGRRFDVKLHLLGSSPLPSLDPTWRDMTPDEQAQLRSHIMKQAVAEKQVPAAAWAKVERAIEIDRNLRQLEAEGIAYVYHACEITDRQALAKTLAEVRRQDGPIQGLVHGAGFESALRFEKKKRDLVERTFAVKVDGAARLMSLTADDPLQYFLAFGSVSGRFGGIGQTDYAAANDMLSKLVGWYRLRRPACRAATFHWHAWDEVGMAVRPESSHLRDLGNITYMPTREGAEHLINELAAGLPESEVVITGWPFHKLDPSYASKLTKSSGDSSRGQSSAPPSDASSPAPRVAATPVKPRLAATDFPLIDGVSDWRVGERIVGEVNMDPVHDPFLAHHLYKGRPLTPAVITLAAVAQTAQQFAGSGAQVSGLRDVQLIEPMRFHSDRQQLVRVRGTAEGKALKCEVTSDFFNRSGKLVQRDRLYQRATAEFTSRPEPLPGKCPLMVADSAWHEFVYRDDLVIWHGPAFRALKQVAIRGPYAWGRIDSLDSELLGGRRRGDWLLPCAAIDAAFYTCGMQVRAHVGGVAMIPQSIERLRWGRLPRTGEPLLAWACCNEMDTERANFDFFLFGDNEEVIVHAMGYHGVFVPRGGRELDEQLNPRTSPLT